jgi:hypothetical protein
MMRVLHVTDPNAPTDPDPSNPGDPQPCAIQAFKLWDADQDLVIEFPFDGSYPICKEDFEFSIEAVAPAPTCQSVRFELTGDTNGYSYTRDETTRLWTLWGNEGQNVFGRLSSVPNGDYTLTAFGYNGVETFDKTVTFTVKNCDTCEVTRFELWDATTNAVVDMYFTNGSTICNNQFGQYGISIRAVADACNKVVFKVTGSNGYSHDQIETTDPYFAWANSGSNVFGENLDEGSYTLTARGNGDASLESTLTFVVVDNCP